MQQPDNFVKWMLGVSATVIVAVGGALFSTVLGLREDMAVIKHELSSMQETMVKIDLLQNQVANHEYRLQWIERDPDNKSAQDGTQVADTIRRQIR